MTCLSLYIIPDGPCEVKLQVAGNMQCLTDCLNKWTNFTKCAQPQIRYMYSMCEHSVVNDNVLTDGLYHCKLHATHTDPSSISLRVELYDPYDPGLPESELRIALSKNFNHSTSDQDINPDRRHLSPGRETLRHWNSTPGGRLFDTRDFSPETRPGENRLGQRLPERRVYSPDTESLDRPGYGSISRPLDHRVCSPDRMVHGSSNQQIPATYGGRKTNGEERITVPEHRREV